MTPVGQQRLSARNGRPSDRVRPDGGSLRLGACDRLGEVGALRRTSPDFFPPLSNPPVPDVRDFRLLR